MADSARLRLRNLAGHLCSSVHAPLGQVSDPAAARGSARSRSQHNEGCDTSVWLNAIQPSPCMACYPQDAHASKVLSADEAIALVPSTCCVTIGGFVGSGCPELLLNALRQRFDRTSQPNSLSLLVPVSSGDRCVVIATGTSCGLHHLQMPSYR